jgi:outer membrane receptor protein involved in Fe transport
MLSGNFRWLACVSLVAVCARGVAAQQPSTARTAADSAARADSIRSQRQRLKAVTIVAAPVTLDEPSNALRINAPRLRELPSTDTWDLLRQAAGLEVHQQGQGPGFASDASMRGFSSDHSTDLALWIDGVPINEPVNGHAEGYNDFTALFPQAVAGLDVIRGPTSALFGNFALAGTINVQTLERATGSTLSLSSGSFGRAEASYLAGFDHGARGSGVFGFRFARQDGFRPNSENNLEQGHVRVVHDLSSSTRIDGGIELYDVRWRSPGFLGENEFTAGDYGIVSNPSDGGFRQRAQERASLRVLFPDVLWRTTVYSTQARWQLFLTIPPAGGRFEGSGSQTEEEDTRYGLGLTSAATWSLKSGEFTVGVESRWDHSNYENWFTTARQRDSSAALLNASQLSGALFAAFDEDLTSRLRLSVGGRFDDLGTTSRPEDNSSAQVSASHAILSPKAGLTARLTDRVAAFANVSRGFRSTDGVISDPTLPLITVWAYESGLRVRDGRSTASVALYQMNVSDEQTFNPITRGSSSGGASRRQGVEVDWSVPLGKSLATDGSWSFIDAIYATRVVTADDAGAPPIVLTGLRVYNTAKYVGSSSLAWSRANGAQVFVAGNWVGPYSPFDEPGVVLGAYGLLHVSAKARVRGMDVEMGVRNALDRRYPEVVAGHLVAPGEGRAVFGGVKVSF